VKLWRTHPPAEKAERGLQLVNGRAVLFGWPLKRSTQFFNIPTIQLLFFIKLRPHQVPPVGLGNRKNHFQLSEGFEKLTE
jgi:hypothetical protein